MLDLFSSLYHIWTIATRETQMQRPSARANKPHGYKAVIVHGEYPFARTESLAAKYALSDDGRSMVRIRAARNFGSRDEAIDYARKVIEFRERERAEKLAAYEARKRTVG